MFYLENNHMDTNTTTPHNITKTPHTTEAPHITEPTCTTATSHNITKDPSTEESEGYKQFLQTYEVELNNIMNSNNDNNNSDKSIGLENLFHIQF